MWRPSDPVRIDTASASGLRCERPRFADARSRAESARVWGGPVRSSGRSVAGSTSNGGSRESRAKPHWRGSRTSRPEADGNRCDGGVHHRDGAVGTEAAEDRCRGIQVIAKDGHVPSPPGGGRAGTVGGRSRHRGGVGGDGVGETRLPPGGQAEKGGRPESHEDAEALGVGLVADLVEEPEGDGGEAREELGDEADVAQGCRVAGVMGSSCPKSPPPSRQRRGERIDTSQTGRGSTWA